jgi:hypothetical protein
MSSSFRSQIHKTFHCRSSGGKEVIDPIRNGKFETAAAHLNGIGGKLMESNGDPAFNIGA